MEAFSLTQRPERAAKGNKKESENAENQPGPKTPHIYSRSPQMVRKSLSRFPLPRLFDSGIASDDPYAPAGWRNQYSSLWRADDGRRGRKAVKKGKAKKVVQAQTLWFEILKSQIETGTPYMLFKTIRYMAECVVGTGSFTIVFQPLFPGESAVDQLVEIIKVLGTPTREEIRCMNPNYTDFRFPQIKACPWHKVFHKRMPQEAINLASRLL